MFVTGFSLATDQDEVINIPPIIQFVRVIGREVSMGSSHVSYGNSCSKQFWYV